MRRYIIKTLILLDIVWAGLALIYDYSEIFVRPIYLWPIIIICPLYPVLLAYVWWRISTNKNTNRYLFALGVIGATYFGLSALLFYPLSMFEEGFSWPAAGAIFWVVFYGAQGAYLLRVQKNRLFLAPAALALAYLLIKLYLDWRYYSFNYLITPAWHSSTRNLMAGFQLFILILIATIIYRRQTYSLTK